MVCARGLISIKNLQMKNQLLTIIILLGIFGCKEKETKTTNTKLDKVIQTNANVLENVKQGVAKGNDGQAIANWFPEKLLFYTLDKDSKDLGEGAQSRASVNYQHPKDSNSDVMLEVWDGNGPAALAVKNMIAMAVEGTVEEKNSQLRRKVYLRKGRKSAEREIYESGQVNISFEVDGRFYTTLRSGKNTLPELWEMADLLNFDVLKAHDGH